MEANLDLPVASKKLAEASFFLGKMAEQEQRLIGDKAPFDHYLSAFLNAAMSIRNAFQVRQNRAQNDAIKAWRAQWEEGLTPHEKSLYEFMREDRVAEVHDTGSSRTAGQKGVKFGIGSHRTASGLIEVSGPPDMPPAVVYRRTFHFAIDGVERRATEACREYVVLLQRMVAEFEAAKI